MHMHMFAFCVSVQCVWMLVVLEAFPAAERVCGLSGPVSGPSDKQAEGVEVGAT